MSAFSASDGESNRTLLVTGASGHLGRRVAELLLGEGLRDRVVAMSRSVDRLGGLEALGAETRSGDFDDPASLDRAFRGVDRLLIVSTDAVGQPGRRGEQHKVAIAAAARAGVRHVVYTSLTNPTPDSPLSIARDHLESEAALAAAPFGFTALRNNLYAEFLVEALVEAAGSGSGSSSGPGSGSGEYVTARGEGAIAYVSREDCARAAAAALASFFDGRRTMEVSGPEALTGNDLATLTGELTGRPVRHVSLAPEAWTQRLVEAGVPRANAELYVAYELAAARGLLGTVSDTVLQLTGTPPRSVREQLRARLSFPS